MYLEIKWKLLKRLDFESSYCLHQYLDIVTFSKFKHLIRVLILKYQLMFKQPKRLYQNVEIPKIQFTIL